LPFIPPEQGSTKLYERLPEGYYSNSFDLVVGHLEDTSTPIIRDSYVNLSKINTKYVCLGHIHNPVSKSYIGSVVPNSISEKSKKAVVRIYEKDKPMTEVEIPSICDYYDVTYPDPLPAVNTLIPIWTIYNCRDSSIAAAKYGNIYIRKCIYELGVDFNQFRQLTSRGTSMSTKDLIDDWFKQATTTLPEKLQHLLVTYAESN
jgi:hypothetical protein